MALSRGYVSGQSNYFEGFSTINPYPTNFFLSSKYCLLNKFAAYFQMPFITRANTMNPDQTAPREQSDLGPYCLQYKPPKYENRQICHEWRA